jgi:hypothetical protein
MIQIKKVNIIPEIIENNTIVRVDNTLIDANYSGQIIHASPDENKIIASIRQEPLRLTL